MECELSMKNKEDFYFITNFIKCLLDSYKLLLHTSGLNESDYIIETEAFSVTGELLPNHMALYIIKKKDKERNLFYYLSDHAPEDVAKVYREKGYPILPQNTFAAYVGMSKEFVKYLCEEHRWEDNADYPSDELWDTIGLIQETSLNEIKTLLDGKYDWTYALSGQYLLFTGSYRIFIRKGEDLNSVRELCHKYLTVE